MEKWQKGKHRQGIVKLCNWNSVFVEHKRYFFHAHYMDQQIYHMIHSEGVPRIFSNLFCTTNSAFILTKKLY